LTNGDQRGTEGILCFMPSSTLPNCRGTAATPDGPWMLGKAPDRLGLAFISACALASAARGSGARAPAALYPARPGILGGEMPGTCHFCRMVTRKRTIIIAPHEAASPIDPAGCR